LVGELVTCINVYKNKLLYKSAGTSTSLWAKHLLLDEIQHCIFLISMSLNSVISNSV